MHYMYNIIENIGTLVSYTGLTGALKFLSSLFSLLVGAQDGGQGFSGDTWTCTPTTSTAPHLGQTIIVPKLDIEHPADSGTPIPNFWTLRSKLSGILASWRF